MYRSTGKLDAASSENASSVFFESKYLFKKIIYYYNLLLFQIRWFAMWIRLVNCLYYPIKYLDKKVTR